MSVFSRLTDIVNANIVHMLDKAEDPVKMVRLIIQEMEDTLVDVKSTAARMIAEEKTIDRKIKHFETLENDWQEKAELAVRKSRDDLAKGALRELTKAQEGRESLRTERSRVSEALNALRADIATLEAKLTDAKKRRSSIVAREESAKSRQRIQQHVNNDAAADAFAKFEAFEHNIDRMEGENEAFQRPFTQSLEGSFAELEKNDAVEQQLADLKSRMAKKSDTKKNTK